MTKNHSYIIADHIRTACIIISDGITPSGKQRGYVLRRLIRRALSSSIVLNIDITNSEYFENLVDETISIYKGVYDLSTTRDIAIQSLNTEAQKYLRALKVGEKEWGKVFQKNSNITTDFLAEKTWDLYQTHGVPLEASEGIIENQDVVKMNMSRLEELVEQHQKKSQTISKEVFKSGLGEHTDKTKKLHTLTHLLHQELRNMLGETVKQTGSAITEQKARFDFTFDRKLDNEEIERLENKIQAIINSDFIVKKENLNREDAKKSGAIGLFGEKYGDIVTVYTITDINQSTVYSKEFCGGPHADNAKNFGKFKIIKQKSVGSGKKRIEFNLE